MSAPADSSLIERIELLFGADSSVDQAWLADWATEASADFGLGVSSHFAADEAELLDRLRRREPGLGIVVSTGVPAATPALAEAAASGPTIWLSMGLATAEPPAALREAGVQTIRGRGLDGLVWAVKSMLARSRRPPATSRLRPVADQVGDLWLPDGDGPFPVVVLIHGGAWRANWERDLMDSMAVDLAARGFACWNLEYRRVGLHGGWPRTGADVRLGIDRLAGLPAPLDRGRIVLVGHSAGGQLALWAAPRTTVPISSVVSLAGVPDLIEGARRGVYERAIELLMGGLPEAVPDRYVDASPAEQLPLGTAQVLIHGLRDLADNVDMNRGYARRARGAGDAVEMVELPEADHFDVIDPGSAAWERVCAEIARGVSSDRGPGPRG